MSKCPGYPTDKFKKALERKGFEKDRSKGGHEVWERKTTQSITIPIHDKEINGAIAKRLDKEYNLGLFK